jgi:hypothetical protein
MTRKEKRRVKRKLDRVWQEGYDEGWVDGHDHTLAATSPWERPERLAWGFVTAETADDVLKAGLRLRERLDQMRDGELASGTIPKKERPN